MKKEREQYALLSLYCLSESEDHKKDLYPHHLEKKGFTEAEAKYLLERFEKMGLLEEAGFFSTYYRISERLKDEIDKLFAELLED
ncbi:hypothetical protein NYE37_13655 [Thermoactinomyces sp. FSL K6-2592]|jgi:hypothetical protein|uniref:hypothetical protein n=1 Tax=Thermoactinomyces sp. FSL K6-2592 TaxID=2975347 RepID=UPI0030FA118E